MSRLKNIILIHNGKSELTTKSQYWTFPEAMQRSIPLRNIYTKIHKIELIFFDPIFQLNSLNNKETAFDLIVIFFSDLRSIYSPRYVHKQNFATMPSTQLYQNFKHVWPKNNHFLKNLRLRVRKTSIQCALSSSNIKYSF